MYRSGHTSGSRGGYVPGSAVGSNGRGGTRHAQQLGQRRVGYIGYGRLMDWFRLRDKPSELIAWMTSNLPEISNFLEQDSIRGEHMELFMVSLQTVLKVKCHENIFNSLLEILASSSFYKYHVLNYMKQNNHRQNKDIADTVVQLVLETAVQLPSCVETCRDVLIFLCNNFQSLSYDVKPLNDAVNAFNSAGKKQEKKDKHQLRRWRDNDDPPDDIRDISIFPTQKDLDRSIEPFLRRNKVSGAYRDKRHYFDVLFRLMREDFIQPLRMGIANYRAQGSVGKDSDMLFYENVKIVGLDVFNGIDHVLLLDIKNLRGIRWDSERRLIFGSLICLSHDDFKTIIYATVTQMDRDELRKGVLKVRFQNCLDDVYLFSSEDSLTMTENPSFFEAYRHVLEGLQEMLEKPLPMELHFVHCQKKVTNPYYITESSFYDLSCLQKAVASVRQYRTPMYQVLQPFTWPHLNKLNLNQEQLQAVINALTKELALIQGPPGTGKTYVGLKIMQILLNNAGQRFPSSTSGDPILVVCYTNHALDQFLEGILKFCNDGIVRVGGKNETESLKQCNLKELRRYDRDKMSTRNCIKDCHREMDSIGEKIKILSHRIQMAHLVIQDTSNLKGFMGLHRYSFQSHSLKVWLRSTSTDFDIHLKKAVTAHLVSLVNRSTRNYREDTCLNFQRYIPRIMRVLVYRYWVSHYVEEGGVLPEDELLSDKDLKKFIEPSVYRSILRYFSNIQTWVHGSTINELLDTIEEIQHGNIANAPKVFDDSDEYTRVRDQRLFGDDSDDEDEQGRTVTRQGVTSGQMSAFYRAKIAGVDLTRDSNAERGEQTHFSLGKVIKILKGIKPMSEEEERSVTNVWQLQLGDRYRLYKLWVQRYLAPLKEEIRSYVDSYDKVLARKQEIRQMQTVDILKRSKVIGMTTTGAAKHRHVLQAVGPRIVVVEEAAEVLEAHIVTALSEHCKHLILIGDHKQLRPKTEVYELAKNFGLEISLFERLVNNGVSRVQLVDQHRMRPEIAEIMRHIYPSLTDSKSVENRDHIKGMGSDVFFIKHNEPESIVKNSKSKLNDYEAKYVVRLCEYLLSQGYKDTEITVLATYGGQVALIKEYVNVSGKSYFENLRVSTVDNFQGEQNKIIVLSLVRSNQRENVGFLSTDNRVCVALSRAQFGMYVIGDIDLLSRNSTLWEKIKATAVARNSIGDTLQLCCQSHKRVTEVKDISDFDKARDGGCGHPCKEKLSCGHECNLLCHVQTHSNIPCGQPCTKRCPVGHKCASRCGFKCPPCQVVVVKKLTCGHNMRVPCYKNTSGGSFECKKSCENVCLRGHPCPSECSKACPACSTTLECGHICNKPISLSSQVEARHIPCHEPCKKTCRRGHKCVAKCFQICPPCEKHVRYRMKCGHAMVIKCHEDTQRVLVECAEQCTKTCERGHQCPAKCGEKCPPCQKTVFKILQCGHRVLVRCCKADSTPATCTEKCNKYCENGHKCPRLCGEPCQLCVETLKCGHKCLRLYHGSNVEGHGEGQLITTERCRLPCLKTCERDHVCDGVCGEICPPCKAVVNWNLPCGHKVQQVCSRDEPYEEIDRCKKPCTKQCVYGHTCPGYHHGACPPCKTLVRGTMRSCRHNVTFTCYQRAEVECEICDTAARSFRSLRLDS